jgi:hypothetical protein
MVTLTPVKPGQVGVQARVVRILLGGTVALILIPIHKLGRKYSCKVIAFSQHNEEYAFPRWYDKRRCAH